MNKSGALQKAPLLLSKEVLPFRDRKNILILNDKYIPVYNAYSGQTETMQAKWANLKKMEEEQEKKAIISYEQLLKNASNITLSYKKENNEKGCPKINKIEVQEKEVTQAISYLEEEEFLKILKEFRLSL